MIAFDPSLKAAEYLDMALLDKALPARIRPLLNDDYAFGLDKGNLDSLLDPAGWRRKPPRVRVVAAWNRRGNIRISCVPHTSSEFLEDVPWELFWFRGFHTMMA